MSSAESHSEPETKVTSLELFFDLVFVFAVTQVTGALAADATPLGAIRGLLVLAAVWWAWTAYAWLTNEVHADRPVVRLSLLAAMAAMLIVSLCVPQAFGRSALPFAVSLFVVRSLHLLLFALIARTAETRRAVALLAPGVLLGGCLLVVASFTRGTVQLAIWIVAMALDYAAPLLGDGRGWHVSPAHFAERHGLIVIIALGEGLIAIGVGASGLPLDAPLVAAAALGLLCAFCLWWAYFDRAVVFAERKLTQLHGEARNRLARDSYSYLHLPIVTGIVLFALGAKKTLGHTGEHLHGLGAIGLGLGPALVLATLSLLRKRHWGQHNRFRLAGAALCVGSIGIGMTVSALAAMAAVALVLATVVGAEEYFSRRLRARAA